jgi:hypothetical protein
VQPLRTVHLAPRGCARSLRPGIRPSALAQRLPSRESRIAALMVAAVRRSGTLTRPSRTHRDRRKVLAFGCASVPLASEDSQVGVRMRVCLDGQDRTHPGFSRGSGAAWETGEGSQHAAEDRVAVADRAVGRRGHWCGRGGKESGQERALRAPLAAALRRQGGGRLVEGRHPPARAQSR